MRHRLHWMDLAVGVTGVALGGAEAYAIANNVPGDTISERVRIYFRVKEQKTGKLGAFVFLAFLGTFSTWFATHIVGNAGRKV